ncbi:hypothetical protein GF312_06405 [Candidatus Poribacteria bacterium]|nr:hypothetical protein [Candidatus Poribacteria bacterium]
MQKLALIICLIITFTLLIGCSSKLMQTVFKEQEWSDNYALADGVESTSPEMVDGDLGTSGEAVFPEKVYGKTIYGAFPSAEAEVILPEKKSIRKIVIYSEDLESFSVLSSLGDNSEWKIIEEFDNNTEDQITIRASAVADRIKIRARAKSVFDGTQRGVANGGIISMRTSKVEPPVIKEIEIYGFKSTGSKPDEIKHDTQDIEKDTEKHDGTQAPLF